MALMSKTVTLGDDMSLVEWLSSLIFCDASSCNKYLCFRLLHSAATLFPQLTRFPSAPRLRFKYKLRYILRFLSQDACRLLWLWFRSVFLQHTWERVAHYRRSFHDLMGGESGQALFKETLHTVRRKTAWLSLVSDNSVDQSLDCSGSSPSFMEWFNCGW